MCLGLSRFLQPIIELVFLGRTKGRWIGVVLVCLYSSAVVPVALAQGVALPALLEGSPDRALVEALSLVRSWLDDPGTWSAIFLELGSPLALYSSLLLLENRWPGMLTFVGSTITGYVVSFVILEGRGIWFFSLVPLTAMCLPVIRLVGDHWEAHWTRWREEALG